MSIDSCVDRIQQHPHLANPWQCHFRTWPALAAASLRRLRRLRIPRSRWQARTTGLASQRRCPLPETWPALGALSIKNQFSLSSYFERPQPIDLSTDAWPIPFAEFGAILRNSGLARSIVGLIAAMRRSRSSNDDPLTSELRHHAGDHVVEIVTVPRPSSRIVGVESNPDAAHRHLRICHVAYAPGQGATTKTSIGSGWSIT
jgi:hypothetical protein